MLVQLGGDILLRYGGEQAGVGIGGEPQLNGGLAPGESEPIAFGRSRANLVPILRVATVEVKREMSRNGIAEARAHRRFAHHSYLAVPQPWSEIMSDPLVLECRDAGLGLICTKQKDSNSFHVHLEAPFHRPDELEVEELLLDWLLDTHFEGTFRIGDIGLKATRVT